MSDSQSVSFNCHLSQVKQAADWTEQTAEAAGLTGRAPLRLALIVEEMFANTIHHAGARFEDEISLKVEPARGGVCMTYRDNMEPFDPLSVKVPEAPDLEAWPIGGLGLRLIRNFSSQATYERADDQNVIRVWIKSD